MVFSSGLVFVILLSNLTATFYWYIFGLCLLFFNVTKQYLVTAFREIIIDISSVCAFFFFQCNKKVSCDSIPRDCYGVQKIQQSCGNLTSNIHNIYLEVDGDPVQVYCDMETDGGGWLVSFSFLNGDFHKYHYLLCSDILTLMVLWV